MLGSQVRSQVLPWFPIFPKAPELEYDRNGPWHEKILAAKPRFVAEPQGGTDANGCSSPDRFRTVGSK